MMQFVLVGIAAGLASALMFASTASGSPLSIPLFYLAPFPVLIASMGWAQLSALVAAALAALGLGLAFGGMLSVVYLVDVGLPAWWFGYLALLGRPVANGSPEHLEWYPAGRLVIWAALLASLFAVGVIVWFGLDPESIQAGLQRLLEALFQGRDGAAAAPGAEEMREFIPSLAVWLPRLGAIPTMLAILFNLWFAARILHGSGRLKRPWPDLSAIAFPSWVPLLLVAAIAGTFMPGLLAMLCWVVTASLLAAYVLLGLAVIHATTRALSARIFILGASYLSLFLLRWPALAVAALIGLLDAALDIRGRVARRGPNPTDVF